MLLRYVVEKDVQSNVVFVSKNYYTLDKEIVTVHLSEDDEGLAPGQFAAFYDYEIRLGSGVILDSWDQKCFPVCTKALEIANMKDKVHTR
ncbi:uncharacterized protein M6B38_192960 [Iris pallida]|uniref:tRNA-specific 2-thiouridylase MnmA-like C-terminal domain-containing protein n=1 Tax=Iris pallida TaxID=29817 RepID=A0AAX6EDI6_IRIPA|nr:uncharacterized protein M6B38_192960 [Iris pallida]